MRRMRWVFIAAVALLALGSGVAGSAAAAISTRTASTSAFDLHWSRAVAPDPIEGDPDALDCVSATDCVAGDGSGIAFHWNGRSWSKLPVWTAATSSAIFSVSCPTATFCAASDGSSVDFLENDVWKPAGLVEEPPNDDLDNISCPTTTFCVVANLNNAYVYNGKKWTTTSSYDTNVALSCPVAGWCVAFDVAGDAMILKGDTWGPLVSVFSDSSDDTNVSCVSASYCLASDEGQVSTFNGSSWTSPVYINTLASPLQVSCYGVSECMAAAMDGSGSYRLSSSGSWVKQADNLPVSELSCPSSTFCLEYGENGQDPPYSATYNGTSWSARQLFDPYDNGMMNDVSCPTTTFCLAIDEAGFALTFNGKQWSSPDLVDVRGPQYGQLSINAVSCSSATFCLAVDEMGRGLAFDGRTWSDPVQSRAQDLDLVSCATPKFCVAVSNPVEGNHDAYIYNGTSWSRGRVLTTSSEDSEGPYVTGISCPTATFCLATASNGIFSYNGKSWSEPKSIAGQNGLKDVSCWTARSCMATTSDGITHFNGTTWSTPINIDPTNNVTDVSCTSLTRCEVADSEFAIRLYREKLEQRQKIFPSDHGFVALSCATPRFCMALEGQTDFRLGT